MFGRFKRRPAPKVVEPIDPVIAARVSTGARLMDSRAPGWYDRVDTGSLDLASNYQCVLGQTYGSYVIGLHKAFGFFSTSKRDKSADHGFDVVGDMTDAQVRREFNELTRAWRVEIQQRQHPTVLR